MRYAIITILSIFIIANLGILGIFSSDMGGGHSFLCNSLLAGDCQAADSGKSMFVSHYLSIMKSLSDAEVIGALAAIFSLLIFLIFHLFRHLAAVIMPLSRAAQTQTWKYKIFSSRLKLLRWIAYHNKGDNAASFGLKNYSYV